MRKPWCRLVACAVLFSFSLLASVRADLFDDARRAIRLQEAGFDTSGATLRGGVGLRTGQAGTTTLLRATASTGGGCGGFNFVASLQQAFDEFPDLFLGLLSAVLTNLPMLALCYASPSWCDLAKHYQGLVNLAIQARYAQCHQIQAAAMYAGKRLRGGNESQCLEDEVNRGTDITTALNRCTGSVSSVRSPSGQNRDSVELVHETLEAAGANQETRTLANALLGTVTISTNGGRLGHSQNRNPGAYLQRFDSHQVVAQEALQAAIDEYRATGTIGDATLRAVSVPGRPMPRVAIEALALLQANEAIYQAKITQVTTGLAATRLTWECTQLQSELAAAVEGNSHITDEERRILELRIASVSRELNAVLQKAKVVQDHLDPALTELVQYYQAVQHLATQKGMQAPPVAAQHTPFNGQLPSGYRQ